MTILFYVAVFTLLITIYFGSAFRVYADKGSLFGDPFVTMAHGGLIVYFGYTINPFLALVLVSVLAPVFFIARIPGALPDAVYRFSAQSNGRDIKHNAAGEAIL